MEGVRAHLRYIQRDGVTREGEHGRLYGADQEMADGKAFLERGANDRHQFRFIVAPEDGAEYDDLEPLTRRLMAQIEEDLGTRLDWVAVDHFNTGHPHTHIIVRGVDERGGDLVIARDYISSGIRERVAELVSLDIGPRTDREIEMRLRDEMDEERFTSLDRRLLRMRDGELVVLPSEHDAFRQTLFAGRLKKLERLGLAEELLPGRWRLTDDLEDTLRRMAERGDIIKTMHREMTEKGLDRSATDYAIHDPSARDAEAVVGRVVARGLSDELRDRHYLIVDGFDGRVHHIDIGKGEATEPTPEGAIVRVTTKRAELRQADRTVAEIASANSGRYSIDIHLKHDPHASEEFAEALVRRLEAMRRTTGGVTREPNGVWIIAPDHLDRVAEYEGIQAKATPVLVETLSVIPLERQIAANGATWLDRELLADRPERLRDSGFGRDVREAMNRRRQWLIAENLAHEQQGRVAYRADMLAVLRRRELIRVAGQLSEQLGLAYVEARPGEQIEGALRRSVELASGKFAVVEKSREFTLVPWRPVLERHIGQQISGVMREEGVSWSIGRQRSGPGVS
ncbi:MAG: conjugal transfer protein TraI [Methylocystaceae bacterium]|nr:MAG: conjugal transfer protein TraI [Methylocystaceae bacterium]